VTESGLALMQFRLNKLKWLSIEKTTYSEEFVCYVKRKFQDFDEEAYYGKNEDYNCSR
jgi:hypothetical protein